MRFLGMEIGGSKTLGPVHTPSLHEIVFEDLTPPPPPLPVVEVIEDHVPEIEIKVPDSKRPASIPRLINPTLNYNSAKSTGRGEFREAEYNLSEMGRIEDTDGYVRQAFSKKKALMFKEGWDLVGSNPKTIRYIKLRLAQIAQASNKSTLEFLRDIGSALIKKSNCFIIKKRKTLASGGRVRVPPGRSRELQPVAAYFIAPAETMEFSMSNGRITKWRQRMPNGDVKSHSLDDVIHIAYDRKEGFVFGTPILIPVIDDVRALRKIEENIELLVYQHLFPMFQWKVGTTEDPAGVTEDGDREVDLVRAEIQLMPSEGGIVTTERHEITAIGVEGRALRAEGYLDHFKNRVFSGLGVSAVDMGEGETSNRATADNMSRNLIDSVKDYQLVFEACFKKDVIDELLLESTFGLEVLDDKNDVNLKFKEIDIDSQIKKEAHHADQFNKDIVTWDEARIKGGHEPILVPTQEQIDAGEDTAEKFPEWNKTRWKLFGLPERLIQALDEPYSPLAKAAARDTSTSVTEEDIGESRKAKEFAERSKIALQAKERAKKASTRKFKDSFLVDKYKEIQGEIVSYLAQGPNFDSEWLKGLVTASMGDATGRLLAEQITAFQNGYSSINSTNTIMFIERTATARTLFNSRAERFITKLVRDLTRSLKRNLNENMEADEMATTASHVFDTLKFRSRFIEDVEVRRAKTYGKIRAMKDTGVKFVQFISNEDHCENCGALADQVINIFGLSFDELPPVHANCDCKIEPIILSPLEDSVSVLELEDSAMKDKQQELLSNRVASCKSCGKTALKVKYTLDTYRCFACLYSWQKDTETSNVIQ